MYDVAVIGAGPAGTTLARLIGRQYRVLLVEKRPLDGPAKPLLGKCCGGLLAPDAQGMLSRVVFNPSLRRAVMRLGIQSMDLYGPPDLSSTLRAQGPCELPEVPGFPPSRE
jgi:2-polyprenyl-6-methoxyphenol hydroxylase-like FAD-dependent oxidoreductase